MPKKFDIPVLNEKSWNEIQLSLDSINKKMNEMENLLKNTFTSNERFEQEMQKAIDVIRAELGLLDVQLGRSYTLEEIKDMIKEMKKKKKGEKNGLT